MDKKLVKYVRKQPRKIYRYMQDGELLAEGTIPEIVAATGHPESRIRGSYRKVAGRDIIDTGRVKYDEVEVQGYRSVGAEYALYQGEELLMIGTVEEIAEARGVLTTSIYPMTSPSYLKRVSANALHLVRLED